MPRLVLMVLSGTESNRGIKFIPRLAIFNPELMIIGFPGTVARANIIYIYINNNNINNNNVSQ